MQQKPKIIKQQALCKSQVFNIQAMDKFQQLLQESDFAEAGSIAVLFGQEHLAK